MRIIATYTAEQADAGFLEATSYRWADGAPATAADFESATEANPGSVSDPNEVYDHNGVLTGVEVGVETADD